jgi:hypothetical protein
MRSSAVFWALVLILVGAILLLGNLGIISVSWNLIWPLVVVALGIWFLSGALAKPHQVEVYEAAIPLEGARRARVRISHGAGRLQLGAGTAPDQVAAGTFGGGLDYRAHRDGEKLNLKLRMPGRVFDWPWGTAGAWDWTLGLNREIPLELRCETGAGVADIDLTDLLVTDLDLETGASSTRLTLPAHAGSTRARIQVGVASLQIRVPDGVAMRMRTQSGLASVTVDAARFPGAGSFYQSPEYDTSPNKIDMAVEAGVGSLDVR